MEQREERDSRDYYLVYLRVNGCYFWFNVTQIVTTIAMLILLYFQEFLIVTILEIIITFMVALDLYFLLDLESSDTFRRVLRISSQVGTTGSTWLS